MLHEFHQLKFIVPEKETLNQRKEAAAGDGSGKAKYSGGQMSSNCVRIVLVQGRVFFWSDVQIHKNPITTIATIPDHLIPSPK